MSDSVQSRLKALAQKQGHPGSLNIADVGHMMQSWKQTKDALERQLAEAQDENGRLREEMRRWVAAYSPDIVDYPSPEAVRAVNTTPEFIVGRNAMMQAIHEGLARILKEGDE